jgi:dUTP pyrophosphatase
MKIKLDENACYPVREHETDAGIDIRTPEGFTVFPHDSYFVDTGVHVELPKGTCGLLLSKSGLNKNRDITTVGVIDEGYSGSIGVKVYNHGNKHQKFERGDKITQLLVIPCLYEKLEVVDEILSGDRGDEGFGSTGV